MAAAGSPSFRTPHTWAPYIIVGRITAEYISLADANEGPHVDADIRAKALYAASPLLVACLTCAL